MCPPNQSKNYRHLVAFASACLALALLLPMVFHPEAQSACNLLHFVCGMLIGVSGTVNLSLVRRKSRRQRLGDGPRL